MNDQIRAREVRLIDNEGNMIGVVPTFRALNMAESLGLDLVEVSINSNPPVCKIADYGKIKYQNQKKIADKKKKQKTVELKELKMSVNIGKGDYDTKLRQAKNFLDSGNRVKFSFHFHGREISHAYLAEEMSEKIMADLEEFGKADAKPQLEGKKMFFTISSIKKKN
ncbi:MAG: translation initiation factor IF-3 [Rickettsiales bacterium]|nr:translation initiation factor IF-3 [Rickettsiales bacterium]